MQRFEIRPQGSKAQVASATQLVWPRTPSRTAGVTVNVGAHLEEMGEVPAAGIDLVRIAAGAFMADRLTSRASTFSRSIGLHAHISDPALWQGSVDVLARLLAWLTGDQWEVQLIASTSRLKPRKARKVNAASKVALLSGGLDSFCGAVLGLQHDPDRTAMLFGNV